MGYNDTFRMSAHAVITNSNNEILQLKATYADLRWGLPGGALDPGETIHDALLRECREELGVDVVMHHLTGMYYHSSVNSHAFIYRCAMPEDARIVLSEEHSEYRYFSLQELNPVQRHRVQHCLGYDGEIQCASF